MAGVTEGRKSDINKSKVGDAENRHGFLGQGAKRTYKFSFFRLQIFIRSVQIQNKAFEIQVTDSRLLENRIVQGMSGSPVCRMGTPEEP